jgi:outer membrane protein OmpA-like peptidoglycan-associated protein
MERISYALVAFGYRSDVGDKTHENWLREMAELLKPGAEIRITGYTDRIGDDRYNLELSQGRADYVAGRLRSLAAQRGIRDIRIDARGVGVETGRFPNELPEGRILSRGATVIIEQRTE